MRARAWGSCRTSWPRPADWARARGVSTTDEARYLREFDHLTLVRLLLAQCRAHQDTTLPRPSRRLCWTGCDGVAETAERAGSLLEIRLLQALVQDAQGRRARALETLGPSVRWSWPPNPRATSGCSWTKVLRWLSLLCDLKPDGLGGHQARRLLRVDEAVEAALAPNTGQGVAQTAVESLSDRELQVLRLLDSELTGPQIARELFVSHNTLRTHTKHIFTKLDVTSRRAAVLRARERGLI